MPFFLKQCARFRRIGIENALEKALGVLFAVMDEPSYISLASGMVESLVKGLDDVFVSELPSEILDKVLELKKNK